MKQLERDTVCYYCYGCNRLEQENFKGVRNCKDLMPAVADWQDKIREELKKK